MNRDTLLCVLAYAHAVVYAILAAHGCGWWGVPCLVVSLLTLWEMRASHVREVRAYYEEERRCAETKRG